MYIVHSTGSLRGQATSALLTQWYRERLYHVAQHYYSTAHAMLRRATLTPGKANHEAERVLLSCHNQHHDQLASQHLYPNPIVLSLHCRVSGAQHTLSLSWFHLPLRSSAWQKVNLWRPGGK
jgi:hypothetical protein